MKPGLNIYQPLPSFLGKTTAIIFFTSFLFLACSTPRHAGTAALKAGEPQGENVRVNFADPSTWLLGYINPVMFSNLPHSEWYNSGRQEYNPDRTVIERLGTAISPDLSILFVIGTWCPDSRREVPRFMKIVEQTGFPADRMTFVGVDITKLAPVGGYDTLNIERVPTFIFLKNKVEAGRIIETPVTSLEQDMLNILTRNEK